MRAKVMSVLFPAPLRCNASYTYPPCARCTAEFAPEHHSVLFLWFLHFTIAGFATLDVHVIDHIFPNLANHLEAPLPKTIWPLTSALDDSHFAHTDHAARPHTHTHTHTHTARACARTYSQLWKPVGRQWATSGLHAMVLYARGSPGPFSSFSSPGFASVMPLMPYSPKLSLVQT